MLATSSICLAEQYVKFETYGSRSALNTNIGLRSVLLNGPTNRSGNFAAAFAKN